MKEYNPKREDRCIIDCPCNDKNMGWCNELDRTCPTDAGDIPIGCSARGEGILIQVKE